MIKAFKIAMIECQKATDYAKQSSGDNQTQYQNKCILDLNQSKEIIGKKKFD